MEKLTIFSIRRLKIEYRKLFFFRGVRIIDWFILLPLLLVKANNAWRFLVCRFITQEEDWWKEVLLSNGFKVPGTEMAIEYDLAQLHETYSVQNLDLWRRQTT